MSHDHDHAPAPQSMNRAFFAGIVLNLAFLVVEVVYGLRSHSLSLVADAAHNFGDVLSLALAWFAAWLMGRQATSRLTYGYRRAGNLAALFNGLLLLVATGGILWEALRRFGHPEPAQGWTMVVVAAIGTVINLGSALFFMRGSQGDLNIRGAFLHLLADAGVSLGVVVGGIGILLTGWTWLDAVISLGVGILVLVGAWPLFRNALDLSMDAVPPHVDLDAVQASLLEWPQVGGIHHLHVWALSTTSTALSVHLVLNAGPIPPELVHDLARALHDRFEIDHTTIQVEMEVTEVGCPLGHSTWPISNRSDP